MVSADDFRRLAAVRRLGLVSMLLAVACLLGTAGALMLLPYAGPAGQVIVGGAGLAVAGAAFAFGRMISLRRPGVRRIGFVAVGLAAASAVLFALLAVARPEAAGLLPGLAGGSPRLRGVCAASPGALADGGNGRRAAGRARHLHLLSPR